MKNRWKKGIAAALTACMTLGMFGTVTMAEEKAANIWNGDSVALEIAAGTDGYNFISYYPGVAYEMSNHMVSTNGGVNNSIPQTLMLLDADTDYTWTPNGVYSFGVSNYDVLYCCDADTGYENGVYYKRLNLEDAAYYTEEAAAHIRAIVSNSYPNISLEQMKANLAAEGFADADKLTRAEIIAAVQTAVWAHANGAIDYRYSQTFDVSTNPQWGKVMHDYTNEMDVWWTVGWRKFSKDEDVAARINALADYLMNQDAVYAEKNQIIISDLQIVDAVPVMEKDGFYQVAIQVVLNNSGSSELDDLVLTVMADDEVVYTEDLILGTETYTMMVEARAGQTIQAVVSGNQVLPVGAYFYEPRGGRDVSQCLVGVAQGNHQVYVAESVSLAEEETSYCDLVLKKVDEEGNSLAGAVFELYAEVADGLFYVDTYETDEQGELRIEKLLPGTYELAETVAPDGYNLPFQNITFTVMEDGETAEIEVEAVPGLVTYEDMVMEVVNYQDEVLGDNDSPHTGNPISMWFAVAMMSGMAMAGMIVMKRKKA